MQKQEEENKLNYRSYFENEVNTQQYQNRVLRIASKVKDLDSKNVIVKHLTSDQNIRLKAKVARMAATQDPIAVARWFERFLVDILVVVDEEQQEEDTTDQFGFQL